MNQHERKSSLQPVVNETCPIEGKHVDPAAPQREFHGEFLGFCCESCASKWDSLPTDQKMDMLADVDIVNE